MARMPAEFENFPDHPTVRLYWYRAVVKYWVDGDTLDVLCSYGQDEYGYKTLRVAFIDTPEIRGEEAFDGWAAQRMAAAILPIGSQVWIHTHKDKASFGRYVAEITMPDGRDFATVMVDEGFAEWSKR